MTFRTFGRLREFADHVTELLLREEALNSIMLSMVNPDASRATPSGSEEIGMWSVDEGGQTPEYPREEP